jgi:hypothetical protein
MGAAVLSLLGYASVLSVVVYIATIALHLVFWLPALGAFAVGALLVRSAWRLDDGMLLHLGSAGCALLVVILAPAVMAFHLMERSANEVSGGKYCYFQDHLLTHSVTKLSFVKMLGRRSHMFGPPHVVLISAEQAWLWSFWERRFIPWQGIRLEGGTPALQGSEVIGRPSDAQVLKCFQMIGAGVSTPGPRAR